MMQDKITNSGWRNNMSNSAYHGMIWAAGDVNSSFWWYYNVIVLRDCCQIKAWTKYFKLFWPVWTYLDRHTQPTEVYGRQWLYIIQFRQNKHIILHYIALYIITSSSFMMNWLSRNILLSVRWTMPKHSLEYIGTI